MQHDQRTLLFGAAFLLSLGAMAQAQDMPVITGEDAVIDAPVYPAVSDPDFVFTVVEQMPEFSGGRDSLFAYIAKSVKYPEAAAEEGIQGRVFLRFIVERDGSTSDVQVLRGVHPMLDREAVRMVKAMPAWKPAKQRGQPVRVQYSLPVNFVLSKE
ncbi:MAG: energy transducer TonB [Flavobacteriales bacterium]|nr:energy transducer TonB [Flavobacteriales bacterium]